MMQLKNVLATELLNVRVAERQQVVDQTQVTAALGTLDGHDMSALWDAVTTRALLWCHAQSAGVSIFADPRYDELTWTSVAGHLEQFATRRYPRRHSLCGVCLDKRATQLFIRPHLYFQWIAQAGVRISEALVVPLWSGDAIYGTVWVMAHDEGRRFTADDARILTMLGNTATGRRSAKHLAET